MIIGAQASQACPAASRAGLFKYETINLSPLMTPRGIRNNNPLNIRRSGQPWRGKITYGNDPSFEQFESMAMGIRAAMIIVRTYIRSHHLDTPVLIVSRWAPPCENSTTRYIDFVCEKSGLQRSHRLTLNSKFDICRLLWAMAWYENGQELPFADFIRAWSLI